MLLWKLSSCNFFIFGKDKARKGGEKVTITVTDSCVGCGLCACQCPGVFTMAADGRAAAADEIPGELEEMAVETAQSCPAGAILVEE